MRTNLTSQSQSSFFGDEQNYYETGSFNGNNPAQLRRMIEELMNKSKVLVQTLEGTVGRLEKAQGEKNFWKGNYLRFKEACEKYMQKEQIEYYRAIVEMQEGAKTKQIERKCLIEQSNIKINKKQSFEAGQSMREGIASPKPSQSIIKGRKMKINKSIKTILYNSTGGQYEHRIKPTIISMEPKPKEKVSRKI